MDEGTGVGVRAGEVDVEAVVAHFGDGTGGASTAEWEGGGEADAVSLMFYVTRARSCSDH